MGLMTWPAKSRDIAGSYCRKGETARVSIAKLKSYASLSSFTKPARAAALVLEVHRDDAVHLHVEIFMLLNTGNGALYKMTPQLLLVSIGTHTITPSL